MARRNALGNVYRLAWKHENARVRRAALYLLVKGQVTVEYIDDYDELAIKELANAGCTASVNRDVFPDTYTFTCDGARECYENGAFFDFS